MIDSDFIRLRSLHERLRNHTHKRLRIDLTVEAALADLRAAQDRVHRDCQTLRETLAMGAR